MKFIDIANTDIKASQIVLGCMRLNEPNRDAARTLAAALDQQINFFDHADIYGAGSCEQRFGEIFEDLPYSRDQVYLQSKAGIIPGRAFDFSKAHLIESAEASLRRLRTDYLDVFLLHRPDALMEPEEVAEAFYQLEKAGKVRYFGVSNQNPSQIELLKTAVKQPLVVNQMQFGLKHTGMIDAGLNVNMLDLPAYDRDGQVIEYSRKEGMTLQAWSPFQYGFFEGVFLGNDKFSDLNQKLQELAEAYQVTPTGIAVAWINRHPAKMQTIIGTMSPERIEEIISASDIKLTREEWYALYMAAGNRLP